MDFYELLDDVVKLLHQRGRVTYRALKRQFNLNDDILEDLKEEILYGQRLAVEEDGRVLVWTGGTSLPPQSISSPSVFREEPQDDQQTRVAPRLTAARTPEAERRQLTVLFCDLVDSTVLASQLDPEDWREVVRAYQETCAKVIARFEGHIAQYLGDGLLVYFGYPLAHEDDAQRAVRAGLAMIEALGQLHPSLGQDREVHLAVRLGIHTGLVVVGDVGGAARQEQLALGETPNVAARLQGIAAPNTLVISAATFQLLGGFFACQPLGTPPLKGLAQPLEGFVVQYGLPLAEVVPLFAPILSLPLTADYTPLSISPEQQKQKTLQAFLTILLRVAAQQPVLFVMEDLHWVDPSTLEFLTLLVDQGPTACILALCTCRPDFTPPWTGRSHVTQVTLPRLPRRQAAEIAGRVAHGKTLPPEVIEQIVAKTDGVPLFVEELTKMVLESGLLEERDDRYALTGPLPPLAIPATLHDSLMARLDRLAAVKSLAQLGATLGREFAYNLLQAVSLWDEETLQRGLQQLVAAEFLYQQGLPPQATYVFKHALIQETAYQSLLRSTRQQYHQRVAQVLEAQFPDTAETQPELLAHHYAEAGLLAQALPYWQRAGQRAIERSAHVEAISHLTRGLEVLAALPDTAERTQHELVLQTTLGSALMAAKGQGAPEVGQAYARARELCRQVGETPQLFPVLFGLWRFYQVRAEHQTARELAEQCFSLAQRVQDPTLLLEAHFALGVSLLWLGEVVPARAHLEQGIALYDPQEHGALAFHAGIDLAVWCLSHAAQALWALGYPDQALERNHIAHTLAQELSHPPSLAAVLFYVAYIHCYRGEAHAAQEQAEAAMALAREQGFPQWLTTGTIIRGWALAMQGQAGEGTVQIRQALAAWRAMGAGMAVSHWLVLLAEAYGHAGQAEEGLRLLAEAVVHVDSTEEHKYAAEVYWLKGELLLQQTIPDQAQAETCLHQALDIARHQQTKAWELRAAMSLCRLWQQQGKRAEAYDLLAPVYGWFTEGFDTADLQEAKALLEELS